MGDRLAGPDPAGAAAEPPAAAATRYPTRTPHVRYTADPSSTREAAFAALTGGGSALVGAEKAPRGAKKRKIGPLAGK